MSMTRNWLAVRCKNHQELTAREHLRRQHFEVYLPLLKSRRRRLGQWFDASEPLFPGYLFVCADLASQSIAPIRSTRGALGVVRFGDCVAVIPAEVVESLRIAEGLNADRLHRDPRRAFVPGEPVELTEGRFAGLRGVFSERNGTRRAVVMVDFLGKVNKVCISMDSLAKAA